MPRFRALFLGYLVGVLASSVCFAQTAGETSVQQSNDTVAQAVGQVLERFTAAFNAGNADKIGELFLAEAEVVDEEGTVTQGRKEIRDLFARFFEQFPGATTSLASDSTRSVGPSLMIVEGRRVVTTQDRQATVATRCVLVLLKQPDSWKIASAREQEDDSLSPHERLGVLSWLVGDWMDEGSDSVVRITCRWSEDQNFLQVDFAAQVEGRPALKSHQRIGWDPLTGKIKSWVFDSDGGHGEALWTQVENRWVVKSSAVLPDGRVGSATLILEPQDKDRYLMKGFDRLQGDVALPNFEVAIVRTPPEPDK